jgi:hypothetical protein
VVGTLLFAINQLDVVLRGDADAVVWAKSAVTYVVPFCVSCAGVLVASHQNPLQQALTRRVAPLARARPDDPQFFFELDGRRARPARRP